MSSVSAGSSSVVGSDSFGFDLGKTLESLSKLIDGAPVEHRLRLADRVVSAYYAGLHGQGGSSGASSVASGGKAAIGATVRRLPTGVGGCGARGGTSFTRGHVVMAENKKFVSHAAKVSLGTAHVQRRAGGWCYLKAFRAPCRDSVAKELGSYPTFFSLLAQPEGRYESDDVLDALSVRVSGTTAHVSEAEAGSGLPSFLAVMKALAVKSVTTVVPDSVQHRLRKMGGGPTEIKASYELGALASSFVHVLEDVKKMLAGGSVDAGWIHSGRGVYGESDFLSVSAKVGGRGVRLVVPVKGFSFEDVESVVGGTLVKTSTRRVAVHGSVEVRTYSYGGGFVSVGFSKRLSVSSTSTMLDLTDSQVFVVDHSVAARGGVLFQGCGGVKYGGGKSEFVDVRECGAGIDW